MQRRDRRARRHRRTTSVDGVPPLPPSRAQGPRDRAGDAAVADRRGRARRRAQPACAARVPQHARAARDRRRSAGDGRRAPARVVGAARPARAGRDRRGARSQTGAARARGCSTCATTKCGRRSASRSRRSLPSTRVARAREVGDAGPCRWCRRSRASRRRASWSGGMTAEPATVEVVGPESRVRQLTEATTEPVSVAGSRERVSRRRHRRGCRCRGAARHSRQSATVIVEILPAPVERELAGVPVRWRNLGGGLAARRSRRRSPR